MNQNEVFRATYGYVRGPAFEGQAMVVAEAPPDAYHPGLHLKPATGRGAETFYGIALIQQFSFFGHASKVTVVRGNLVGRVLKKSLRALAGVYVEGSEHVLVNNDSVADDYVLADQDVVRVEYQYPIKYEDYVQLHNEPSFFAFDHTSLTQLPCGREGRYRTQFYVAKPYKFDQRLRLARGGRFQPTKASSPKAIPSVRVISPPSPADPWLGLEVG